MWILAAGAVDSHEKQLGAVRSITKLVYTRFTQAACDVNDFNFQAPVATSRVYATDSNVASAVTEIRKPFEKANFDSSVVRQTQSRILMPSHLMMPDQCHHRQIQEYHWEVDGFLESRSFEL